MKLHFRIYKDYAYLDTICLQMYLKDSDGNVFVVKNIEFEKYDFGTNIQPINRICEDIKIDEKDLKRMSKELWCELEEETAYLKGNLQATKEHLEDMRKMVFKNERRNF